METWDWYDVSSDDSDVSWEEQIDWTRGAVEAMIREVRTPDMDVVLGFFGQVLPDGLIGVANALIDTGSGARFYLAPVESMVGGRDYVTSFLAIEYKDGFVDRLFERARGVLGGNENTLSVYFVPKEHFQEVSHYHFSAYSLFRSKLTQEEKRVLALCTCIFGSDQDFDSLCVGVRLDHSQRLLEALRKIWPSSRIPAGGDSLA
jgi:hypothetical protein